jgi:hypothetical protein
MGEMQKELVMKSKLLSFLGILFLFVVALVMMGCGKSPESLAKETLNLEKQVLEAGTDVQKLTKLAESAAKNVQAVEKLSEADKEKYEIALVALITGVPAGSVPANPVRGTKWKDADDESVLLEFDRAAATFKLSDDSETMEGTYEILTAVSIEFGGDSELGKLSGDTLEFNDMTFKKKSGKDPLKNTKWEGTLEDGLVNMDFTADGFKMSFSDQTVEGKFSSFSVVSLSIPGSGSEELRVDGNTLKNSWDNVIFIKSN